jgi:CBS-domain-containing membrane protein
MGSAAGVGMIALGVLIALSGNGGALAGIWMALIGLLIRGAASSSLQRARLEHALGGYRVAALMSQSPVTVPAELSLRRFVDEYVLPWRFDQFPVVDEQGLLVGVVGAREPARTDQQLWETSTVADVMNRAGPEAVIFPQAPGAEALKRLTAGPGQALVVVEGARPVGILSLGDIVNFVSLKAELSGRRRRGRRA